ncbi:MAG: amidohydrolase family protein [Promethearchaeota archaeon]|jgi:predicted TIM-barrel fold metal-dependent hydrolase
MTYSHNDFIYIDAHSHFFPPQIFKAIWNFFERTNENGDIQGWSINYKLSTEEMVRFLEVQNVKAFTTYNYAHKKGVAYFINEWVNDFCDKHSKAIPFGCAWPEDNDRLDYVRKIIEEYQFLGIKIQPLVQNFYPDDKRMYSIYDLILDHGKWICFHAGTAPYRNKYVGYKNFIKFLEKYPDINVIVSHMGAFEYRKFLRLLDHHENMYLDTTMIFIPDNIFPERKSKQPKQEDLISYQDRILFGSDFPNIPYDYKLSTEGLLALNLPRSFYENVFFNNAKRIFNIVIE